MLLSSSKKIRLGYIIAFLLLLFSFSLTFYSNWKIRRTEHWVSHTYNVTAEIESIKASLAEAENAARGFILTKDERFFTTYSNSIGSLPVHYKKLRELTLNNNTQQRRLDTLNGLIQKRLELFDFGLSVFKDSGYVTNDMKARRPETTITNDSIGYYIQIMKETEDRLLEQRKTRLSDLSANIEILIVLSLIAAIIAIGYSIFLYNHERRAKNKFDQQANQYRHELEERIRELKIINEELTQLRSIERFASTGRVASTIAHEVRNPLTNISLATEQLGRMKIVDSESTLLLEMISRNVVRINQLVSDLLNATKSVQLDLQRVRISELLDETLQLAKDRIDLNDIKVEKNYTDDKCGIEVDAEKIKLAFLNIIINAIEAIENKNGVLRLLVKSDQQKCMVEISDNGKGMNDETLQKIFEPYFTEKSGGNGLGLTNTQNIILSHKGSITVKSEPGKGSVFTIMLESSSPI